MGVASGFYDVRVRSFSRYLVSVISPLDNVGASLVITILAVAVPASLATWLGDNVPIVIAAGLFGVAGLLVWAGLRLQRELDQPLRLAVKDVGFVINEKFVNFDDGQGGVLTRPVFGVRAELINRGDKAVSIKWSLRIKGHEFHGTSYDDALRNQKDGSPFRVLPQSFHNPLKLGKVGDDRSNRKGVIGFFPEPEDLKRLGLDINELIAADLVATNQLSESEESQVFPIPELVQEKSS